MTQSSGSPGGGIVVVGGGISGVTAAVEAAEAGHDVYLLEKEPYLGGRVARMNEYFPKLCPPTCGLEINFKRLKQNPRIRVFTLAEVTSIEGEPGDFRVTVELAPRFVNDRCTACGDCVEVCPEERADDFNYGMGETKAIYLAHNMAYPFLYAVDPEACPGKSCSRCLAYCQYDAIDLSEEPRTLELSVGAVVVATGWKPYDATRMENLGFGRLPDVITNIMMERLAAPNGPTGGKVVRPSDGEPVRRVAFVQCAGSRDENHLGYCSTVCCTATMKQVRYVRDQHPDAEIHVFYIDIRTMGTLEDFFEKVAANDDKLFLHKGKVASVARVESNKMKVVAEDTMSGRRLERVVDLVVLATGMEPAARLDSPVEYDKYGFVIEGGNGIHGAGTARRPVEVVSSVQDATASALRAIQDLSSSRS